MMKKFTPFSLIFLAFAMNISILSAQTPLTTAVDFTVTDVEGHTHVLFDYLNDNKFVVLDFFYTTCGPCQQYAPEINASYLHFGCNEGNVIFLGIDQGDTDAEVIQFDLTYGVEYPSVSGLEGGGNAVDAAYGISAYPTVILIAPDKTILEQDIWPATTSAINAAATAVGGIPQTCSTTAVNELNSITNAGLIDLYPNPANSLTKITFGVKISSEISLKVFNLLGNEVLGIPAENRNVGMHEVIFSTENLSEGLYFINLYQNDKLAESAKLMVAH